MNHRAAAFVKFLGFGKCLCFGLVSLFFMYWALRYVQKYGTNYPFVDDLTFLGYPLDFLAGRLTISSLFAQFNEHRVFFHRIIMSTMLLLFDGNTISLAYLTQVFLFAALVIFFLQLRNQFGSWTCIPIWAVIFPLFLYNTAQTENFLWACQVVYTNSMVLPLCSFYLLDRYLTQKQADRNFVRNLPLLSGIFVLNTVSSYMSSMGLLVWPAMIFQLLLTRIHDRRKAVLWLLFLAVPLMAIEWYFYFHGLVRLPDHKAEGFLFEDPWYCLEFFLSTMGKGLYRVGYNAWLTGTVLVTIFVLATFAAALNKRYAQNTRFWLVVTCFIFLQGLAFTVGRAEFRYFLEYDRYTHFSLWLIPSLTVCLFFVKDLLPQSLGKREWLFSMVVIVLHLLLVPRSLANFQYGEERGRDIRYERSFYYQAHRLQRYYEPDALVQSFGITALRRQSKELAGLNFLPIRYEIDRSQLISRSKTMQPRIGRGWKVVEEGNERYISTREAVEGERNRRLTFRNVQVASNSFITIDVKYGKGTGHFARSDLALHTIVGLDFDKDNKIDRELMPYSIDAISSAKTESIYQVIPDTWTRLVYFLGDTEVSGIAIIIKEDLPGKDGWIAVKFPKVYGSRRLNDDELFSTAISGELK